MRAFTSKLALGLFALSTLMIGNTSWAGVYQWEKEATCYLFDNGKLTKRQACHSDGAEGANMSGGFYQSTLTGKGMKQFDVLFSVAFAEGVEGELTEEDYEEKITLNNKPAVRHYRLKPSYKILGDEELKRVYDRGSVKDLLDCFQDIKSKQEICFQY